MRWVRIRCLAQSIWRSQQPSPPCSHCRGIEKAQRRQQGNYTPATAPGDVEFVSLERGQRPQQQIVHRVDNLDDGDSDYHRAERVVLDNERRERAAQQKYARSAPAEGAAVGQHPRDEYGEEEKEPRTYFVYSQIFVCVAVFVFCMYKNEWKVGRHNRPSASRPCAPPPPPPQLCH